MRQYSFNGIPWNDRDVNSQTWMYASETRQQQAGVPAGRARPYPSLFGNGEGLPLSTPGSDLRPNRGKEWLHHPLTPGRASTWTSASGVPPGGVRSFYTAGNPSEFDVGHHNPTLGASARGSGNFGLANYHAQVAPLPPSPPLPRPPRG